MYFRFLDIMFSHNIGHMRRTARITAEGCQSAEGNAEGVRLKLRPCCPLLTDIPQPQASPYGRKQRSFAVQRSWLTMRCAWGRSVLSSTTGFQYIPHLIWCTCNTFLTSLSRLHNQVLSTALQPISQSQIWRSSEDSISNFQRDI